MARWALLVSGKVCEIFEGETPPQLHPDLQLVEVTGQPEVQPHFTFHNGAFWPPANPIGQLRERAKIVIDNAAENARLLFITPGAGQAMTYMRKLEEARAQQAGGAGPFPVLEASIGIDGADVAAVAATVIAMNGLWTTVAAQIEGVRLGAKAAIDAVADGPNAADEIAAIITACQWPSP